MLEYISNTKTINNTVEAPFGIRDVSTEWKNNLRFKPILEGKIGFLLGSNWYSSD